MVSDILNLVSHKFSIVPQCPYIGCQRRFLKKDLPPRPDIQRQMETLQRREEQRRDNDADEDKDDEFETYK